MKNYLSKIINSRSTLISPLLISNEDIAFLRAANAICDLTEESSPRRAFMISKRLKLSDTMNQGIVEC